MACSVESTSRRQKPSDSEESNLVDMISNLPDSFLCHILSFLPTKESVATSILSSRWKLLWTLVPNLEFDVDKLNKTSTSLSSDQLNQCHFSFGHILSRVWALRNVNSVRKFILKWSTFLDSNPIHVDSCVRAVIAHGVEQLYLKISLKQPFEFPRSLYFCKTLVVLNLEGKLLINPPCASSLPSLKTLHLICVTYANDDSLCTLLSGCLVLQNLFVIVKWEIEYDLKIIVPTLQRLHIHISVQDYILEINAPSLEYLYFRGEMSSLILLENLSNLVEAVVDIGVDELHYMKKFGIWVCDFIRALYKVKSLHLYEDTTQCLINYFHIHPPMFHNLACLNFRYCCNWHALQFVLERTPNLKVLVFERRSCSHYETSDSDSDYEEIRIDKPLNVPKCLSSQLTTFHYKGFGWAEDELEFVRYILKNARFLKKLTITSKFPDSNVKLRLLKDLLRFPKLSRTCKIAFVFN